MALSPQLKILSFTVTAFFGLLIFSLLKRKKLKESLAITWLFFSAALIAVTYRFELIENLAELMKIQDPNNLLLFLALLFIISASIIISAELSNLTYKMTVLAQELALFRYEMTKKDNQKKPQPNRKVPLRVAIVNPPSLDGVKFIREGRCEQRLSSFQYVMVPISLPSIAGLLLSKGYNVKIWDCMADNISARSLARALFDYNPQLIIFNISTPTVASDLEFISKLKRVLPKSHLTAIGTHVTAAPEEVLKESGLDSVIRREPELTSLKLAEVIKTGGKLKTVLGLSFRRHKTIIRNSNRPFCQNLDALPFPARHLLNNQKYTLPIVNQPYTLLVPSRGCPHQCIYCTARVYYGSKVRFRSVKSVMAELEEIVNQHKIEFVTMWSDTFTINQDFVTKLCQAIIKSGLGFSWMCNARVDTISPEMLKLMHQAGCMGISYGVESGNQTILDNIKKGITLEQINQAFRWTRQAGIEALAHVIFGLPGETKETIQQTVAFVINLKPDYAQFYCAIPFPGTELYQKAKEQNWLTTEDWSKFEINQAILNTPLLTAAELDQARVGAYKKFYLRIPYILGRLAKIKNTRDLVLTTKQGVSFINQWVLKK